MIPIPQIPYAAIGRGIAVFLGIWAFLVAETTEERLLIGGIPVVILLLPVLFRTSTGRLVSTLGWTIYGLGCIVFLRLKGLRVR